MFALEAPLSDHFLSVARLAINWKHDMQPHHRAVHSWKMIAVKDMAPLRAGFGLKSVAVLIQQNHTIVSCWDVSDSDRCYDYTSF